MIEVLKNNESPAITQELAKLADEVKNSAVVEAQDEPDDYKKSLDNEIRTSLTGRIALPDEVGILGTVSPESDVFTIKMYFAKDKAVDLTVNFTLDQKIPGSNLNDINSKLNIYGYEIRPSGLGYVINKQE